MSAQMTSGLAFQSEDAQWVCYGCALVLWFLLVKTRCNHIGMGPGNCIGIFLVSFVPLASIIVVGYLLIKKGRDLDAKNVA